jgi:hypothetical protein
MPYSWLYGGWELGTTSSTTNSVTWATVTSTTLATTAGDSYPWYPDNYAYTPAPRIVQPRRGMSQFEGLQQRQDALYQNQQQWQAQSSAELNNYMREQLAQQVAGQQWVEAQQVVDRVPAQAIAPPELVAEELLMTYLDEEQRKTFKDHGWFVVKGGKTGHEYRVRDNGRSRVANVDRMKDGHVVERLCCHIDHHLPHGDHLLAQKVSLEFDEDRFLRKANRHAVRA